MFKLKLLFYFQGWITGVEKMQLDLKSVSVTLRVAFLRSWLSNKANTYYDSHLLQRPEAEQYLREWFFEQNQWLKFTSQVIFQSIFWFASY